MIAFAAERRAAARTAEQRRCCWVPAAVDRYLPHSGPTATNPPHGAAVYDATHRRTDGHRAITSNVRFAGDWGLTPPLVEDNSTLVTENFRLGSWLKWKTNRKSCVSCQTARIPMTLNDVEVSFGGLTLTVLNPVPLIIYRAMSTIFSNVL